MKTKRVLYLILVLTGLALIVAGIFLFPKETQKRAAGACYGLGAAAFALGTAWLAGTFIPNINNEQAKRRKDIDVADERNVLIRDKAGAMVAKHTTYALVLWILAAGLLFSDMTHILPPVILLALRFVLMVHYTSRYSKTM